MHVDDKHKDCILEDEFGKMTVPLCDNLGEFEVAEGVTAKLMPIDKSNLENIYLDFFLNGETLNIPREEFIPFINGGYYKKAYQSFSLLVYYFAENNIYVKDNYSYETFHHFDGSVWSEYDFENAILNNTPDGFDVAVTGVFKVSENYITVPIETADANTLKGVFLLTFSTKDNSYLGYETFSESDWETLNAPIN